MPFVIRLTTMPGRIKRGPRYDSIEVELFGPSLGQMEATLRKTEDIAGFVRRFGDHIRAEHHDASFKINVTVPQGQRKPAGYDAALSARLFGERAFLRVDTEQRAVAPEQAEAAVP